ncbi:MAG: MFS transporter [Lawsonibacter sp.]|jgi:MFS family permease|nr:MFS transporter [Lawsonibacter sp.]
MNTQKSALFTRDFTLVVIGQIISLFGNAILHFALPLYLLRETGSIALFGAVNACSFVPMILMGPIGGTAADRVHKGRIMAGLDFLTAGLTVAYCLLWGKAPLVPLVIVTLMLLYAIAGAYQPAVQASLPLLLSPGRLAQGNAVINMVATLANLLGPALGGVIFGLWGLGPILTIGGVCFFLSAVMEIFIRVPHERRPRTAGVLTTVGRDLGESWRYISRERPVFLSVTLVLSAFNLILSAVMIVGVPAIVAQVLGMSDAALGLTQAVMALGGLFGGLLAGLLGTQLKPRHGSLCLLACAVTAGFMGLVVLPGVPTAVSYWGITLLSMLAMASAMLFTVVLLTLVQSQVPSLLLGKVIACIQAVANCASPLGQAAYGLLFDALPPWAVLLAAALLSALVALRSRRVFRRLEA